MPKSELAPAIMNPEFERTAATLAEALPYIQKYYGQTIVVKYGGRCMVDPALRRTMAQDIVLMRYVGMRIVVVHGGGPQVTDVMKRMGKEAVFAHGLRVTDAETMEIAEMVLAGQINKEVVNEIAQAGGHAVGISGKDAKLIIARKMEPQGGVDLGFVGEVAQINPDVIHCLAEGKMTTVVATIAADEQGQTYNLNADHVAGALAAELKAVKLITLTDVPGIMRDPADPATLISRLSLAEARELLSADFVSEGMMPKIESCITAVAGGVPRAHIVDGRVPHSPLIEVFTDAGIGTMIEGEDGE
jgi:acetylglutamate kinase